MKQMSVLLLVAVMSTGALAETVYTVTTETGTAATPVLLDDLDVEVDDGATKVSRKFSEIYGDFASGAAVFRKRGRGWMRSSVHMGTFTGEIRVEEGAFMVTENLMTGPQEKSKTTVVVSNEASFVLAVTEETCATASDFKLYNRFYLEGDGIDGHGAIFNMMDDRTYDNAFQADWVLNGDTTVSGTASGRISFVGTAKSGGVGTSVTLNDHRLRVVGEDAAWTLGSHATRFAKGFVTMDGTSVRFLGGTSNYGWSGDASNRLVLTNGAGVVFYNKLVKTPWTLEVNDGCKISVSSGSDGYSDISYTNNYSNWQGPIEFHGQSVINGGSSKQGFTPNGGICGDGNVLVSGCWLKLTKASPDYSGALTVRSTSSYPGGLALFTPDALTDAAGTVSLTNAELRLMSDEVYSIPGIHAMVGEGKISNVMGGLAGSACRTLVKDGSGLLKLSAPLSVSGDVMLNEGSLGVSGIAAADGLRRATTFSGLKCQDGTAIELESGNVFEVGEFAGSTSVTGGDMLISRSFTIDAEKLASGGASCLMVSGKLTFAANVAVEIKVGKYTKSSPKGGWLIAEAEGGIEMSEGMRTPLDGFNLRLSDDGKRLYLEHYNGIVLIVR